ncbi:MAG TPA: Rap1a/Tai family immunity protein [Caulobacteraceae bacterium]|nr:Rap1a/Tai family immunity protein [Caulobacteraceae bacterium]
MRRSLVLLSVTAAMGLASAAAAAPTDREFYTGEALYQRCSAAPADTDFAARKAACKAYVLGVSDTLQANQSAQPISGPSRPAAICLPDVDGDQLVDGVTRYLADHADQRRFAAPDLIYLALKAAYACPAS